MDAATVKDRSNYTLLDAGPDHLFGTRDDRELRWKGVTYDAPSDSVTLTLKNSVSLNDSLVLTLNCQRPSGIRDTNGQFLGGWGKYAPSVNELFLLGKPARNPNEPFLKAFGPEPLGTNIAFFA